MEYLTGNFRFNVKRLGLFKKVIVQIEIGTKYETSIPVDNDILNSTRWEDAKVEHLNDVMKRLPKYKFGNGSGIATCITGNVRVRESFGKLVVQHELTKYGGFVSEHVYWWKDTTISTISQIFLGTTL